MKAYKILENRNKQLTKGRLFVPIGKTEILLAATPTLPQTMYDYGTFQWLLREGTLFEEVELEQEKWALPHLHKKLKMELNIKN